MAFNGALLIAFSSMTFNEYIKLHWFTNFLSLILDVYKSTIQRFFWTTWSRSFYCDAWVIINYVFRLFTSD